MDFSSVRASLNDVSAFVKEFIALIKSFVEGFKKKIVFTPPTTEESEEEE
ncbi:MAG: hypothetical protein J1E34_00435 [Oscillospiraceae bacterium]|nr:hypothetical protein [Oscillospiraceae bacterium]